MLYYSKDKLNFLRYIFVKKLVKQDIQTHFYMSNRKKVEKYVFLNLACVE